MILDSQAFKTLAVQVRDSWRECRAKPRPGATAEEIQAVEYRLGISLPPDIVYMFRTVNGTEETCGDLFSAWPVERLGPVPEVLTPFAGIPDYSKIGAVLPNATEYFVFADAMIWSQVLAVRIAQGKATEVVWISGDSFAVIAPTFQAFWERYLADIDSVVWALGATIHSAAG
jgi:hypothetical protein